MSTITNIKLIEKNPNFKKTVETSNLYVQCTKNNTRLTLTTLTGDVLYTITPSNLGFKKGLRSAPNYAYEITLLMISKINSMNIKKIKNVFFKGIGPGRNQVIKAFRKASFSIENLADITTFPFNGCRPKKARRLKRLT